MRNMTTSEAIKWFEHRKSGSTIPGARMVFDMALEVLREKAARENPEPLTLEELRQMDGEPVWAEFDKKPNWKGYRLVKWDDQINAVRLWDNLGAWYDTRNGYGGTWRTYRGKPKEE